MKWIFFPLTLLLICSFFEAVTARTIYLSQSHTLSGDIRFHKNFHSRFLNNNRDIIVYLPPGYSSDNRRRYSVLYLHDGQNLFDGASSFIPGREWRVDETSQTLIGEGKIEPLIIVGVYNTGKERVNEYTPVEDPKYKAGGKADLYGRLLVEELKPFIDATYRTRRDAAHTGLGGSSLGGLVSLYLGIRYPNVFGNLAIVSPSVWWDDKQIVKFIESYKLKKRPRIWLDIGTREGGDDQEMERSVDNARLLRNTLLKRGWRNNANLQYFEAQGAAHNEVDWAARVDRILEFLFAR